MYGEGPLSRCNVTEWSQLLCKPLIRRDIGLVIMNFSSEYLHNDPEVRRIVHEN